MGLLNPLKKVMGGIKKVTGKVTDKLPAPGHTIIGDAIAKKRASKAVLPPLPQTTAKIKPVRNPYTVEV